ncbi:hypothetical protein [Proteus phage 10]|uniref:hypothetical protein n=1 Tax=Proteus TaxID=583 RepID=UPI0015F240E5|nr:hypothetical protein [Proteus columbae]QMP24005.1 hypothetical protein [Proteus phage 10]
MKDKTERRTEQAVQATVPSGSWVTFAGVMSVIVTNVVCLMYFSAILLHVYNNGVWPENDGYWVVLIGPVLTAWQFMDVRKILRTVLNSDNTIGSIVKEVVIRRLGGPTPPKENQKEKDI